MSLLAKRMNDLLTKSPPAEWDVRRGDANTSDHGLGLLDANDRVEEMFRARKKARLCPQDDDFEKGDDDAASSAWQSEEAKKREKLLFLLEVASDPKISGLGEVGPAPASSATSAACLSAVASSQCAARAPPFGPSLSCGNSDMDEEEEEARRRQRRVQYALSVLSAGREENQRRLREAVEEAKARRAISAVASLTSSKTTSSPPSSSPPLSSTPLAKVPVSPVTSLKKTLQATEPSEGRTAAPSLALVNAAAEASSGAPRLTATLQSRIQSHPPAKRRHARKRTFPEKLMDVLSRRECEGAISWLPNGDSFVIVSPKLFVANVLPKYFKEAKFESFTRKLNRWGYKRITKGTNAVAYTHELFRRDMPELCKKMSGGRREDGQQQQDQLAAVATQPPPQRNAKTLSATASIACHAPEPSPPAPAPSVNGAPSSLNTGEYATPPGKADPEAESHAHDFLRERLNRVAELAELSRGGTSRPTSAPEARPGANMGRAAGPPPFSPPPSVGFSGMVQRLHKFNGLKSTAAGPGPGPAQGTQPGSLLSLQAQAFYKARLCEARAKLMAEDPEAGVPESVAGVVGIPPKSLAGAEASAARASIERRLREAAAKSQLSSVPPASLLSLEEMSSPGGGMKESPGAPSVGGMPPQFVTNRALAVYYDRKMREIIARYSNRLYPSSSDGGSCRAPRASAVSPLQHSVLLSAATANAGVLHADEERRSYLHRIRQNLATQQQQHGGVGQRCFAPSSA